MRTGELGSRAAALGRHSLCLRPLSPCGSRRAAQRASLAPREARGRGLRAGLTRPAQGSAPLLLALLLHRWAGGLVESGDNLRFRFFTVFGEDHFGLGGEATLRALGGHSPV